ncbi:MAG: FkbM family methyltransferase [Candidatus Binatus sp.]|uniref:FkbM family methyltransferase n=1 Tax=Candidatus Binatus sp. TaxID=2811406 RepID=UPI0027211E92|nr:FkbM family methyltransferase [Candidatus Binatus sp.]MDO8431595.1 FkbM family methyltransferase [Candidatus Binatus sp.]
MPSKSQRSSKICGRIAGKWNAFRTLVLFQRYLVNWQAVWAAYHQLQAVPSLQLRGGLTIKYGPADDPIVLLGEIFGSRVYDRGGFYRPKAGDTNIDVGANIGMFAIYLEWITRGVKVHCFEPGIETFRQLQQNIEINGLGDCVQAYNFAIADREGTATLGPGQSLVRALVPDDSPNRSAGEQVRTIDMKSALEIAGVKQVDLLKIDVEGSEVEIVRGAGASGLQNVRRVVAEIHDNVRPGAHDAVVGDLRRAGFRIVREFDLPSHAGPTILQASR